jgi:hypothetical protein
MKKSEVRIGTIYRAKVSGNLTEVRIESENPRGGWDGVNLATNRAVRIKTAQHIQSVMPSRRGRRRIATLEEHEAQNATGTASAASETTEQPACGDAPAEAAEKKKSSGLDAAVAVLAEAGEPLNTKDMVERMLASGKWKTGGKTPAATIYAAIIREISVKGEASRFRKVERGFFELTPAGEASAR